MPTSALDTAHIVVWGDVGIAPYSAVRTLRKIGM